MNNFLKTIDIVKNNKSLDVLYSISMPITEKNDYTLRIHIYPLQSSKCYDKVQSNIRLYVYLEYFAGCNHGGTHTLSEYKTVTFFNRLYKKTFINYLLTLYNELPNLLKNMINQVNDVQGGV